MIVDENMPNGYVTWSSYQFGVSDDPKQTETNPIVHEPSTCSSEHGLPIPLQDQPVRKFALHGMLAVLRAVDNPHAEEEQCKWHHETYAEAYAPHALGHVLVVRRKDYKRDDARSDKAEINGEVGRQSNQQSTLLAHICAFVRGFGRASTADRILTSRAEAGDSACDYHHPEHAELRSPMRSSRKSDSKDQECSGEYNASTTADLINEEAKKEHAKDFADQVRVGEPGFDGL